MTTKTLIISMIILASCVLSTSPASTCTVTHGYQRIGTFVRTWGYIVGPSLAVGSAVAYTIQSKAVDDFIDNLQNPLLQKKLRADRSLAQLCQNGFALCVGTAWGLTTAALAVGIKYGYNRYTAWKNSQKKIIVAPQQQ